VCRLSTVGCACLSMFLAEESRAGWQTFGGDLAGGQVSALIEDGSGRFWFATDEGLSRYDGATWRTFSEADGLPANGVAALFEDGDEVIWAGTHFGTGRFDGPSWTTFPDAEGKYLLRWIQSRDVWFGDYTGGVARYDGESWQEFGPEHFSGLVIAVLEDSRGRLWFGTEQGLALYESGSWTTFTPADGIVDEYISSIFEDQHGMIWVGHGGASDGTGGISHFDGTAWTTFFPTAPVFGSDPGLVSGIAEDLLGNLWFSTYDEGALRYDGGVWTFWRSEDGLASNDVRAVMVDHSGNLWFATTSAVSRFDGVTWQSHTRQTGLPDNLVLSMLVDRDGQLWVGTAYGAARLVPGGWETPSVEGPPYFNDTRAIVQDRDGNLWFGTEGGVYRFDGTDWQGYTPADGLAGTQVGTILEDRNGDLWFGTRDGLSRYDGTTWQTFTTADGLASHTIFEIIEDRSGNLWVATLEGLSRFDGTSWYTFTEEDGFTAGGRMFDILEHSSGTVWVTSENAFDGQRGIASFDGSRWEFHPGFGFPIWLFEDGRGTLWFANVSFSPEANLLIFDGVGWTPMGLLPGVSGFHEDRAGVLWAATTGGVSRFDGSQWRTLTSADGLVDNTVTLIAEDKSATLWLGTWGGLSRHSPDRVPPRAAFLAPPGPVVGANALNIAFVAGFGEAAIRFSHRFDGGVQSSWTVASSWVRRDWTMVRTAWRSLPATGF